jgi:hypothetical protein
MGSPGKGPAGGDDDRAMGVTDERVVVGGVVGLGHGKQLFITLPGIQTQEVVPGFPGGDGTM